MVTVPLTERSSQPGHRPRPSPCEPALQPATSTPPEVPTGAHLMRDAIRLNQTQSVAISGNQPPEVPTGAHLMRDAIRRNQTQTGAISGNQPPEVSTGAHVMPMRPSRRSKTSSRLEASTVSEIGSFALTHLWGSGCGRRGEHVHAVLGSWRRGEHMQSEVQSRRVDAPANLLRGLFVTPLGHRLAVDTHLWGTDERAPW